MKFRAAGAAQGCAGFAMRPHEWGRGSLENPLGNATAGRFPDGRKKCVDTSVDTAGRSACATSRRQWVLIAFRWAAPAEAGGRQECLPHKGAGTSMVTLLDEL